MTWKAYQVSFRLLSPMHVGWRKLGNLQQTRPYLIGHSIWGALTARLTREQRSSEYERVGGEVDQQLTFSYFYPYIDKNLVGMTLWPWPGDTWDDFSWTYLGSYASTALEGGHSAEAGSLHETEYIAPHTRSIADTKGVTTKPVYLVGYIFVRDDCTLSWENALDKLQFGGERSYGWGRVRLETLLLLPEIPELPQTVLCFDDYHVNYSGNRPVVTILEGKPLLAHAIAEAVECDGTIEPLVGRVTQKSGFGNEHAKPEICWMPGSKVKAEEKFEIGARGIWHVVKDDKKSSETVSDND